MAQMVTVPPPQSGVYRFALGHFQPFAPPDWNYAHDDGTFGNRFDDPSAEEGRPSEERFRTIYCATQRVAAFGETAARYRLDLNLLSKLEAIDDDEAIEDALRGAVDSPLDPDDRYHGMLTAEWRFRRRMGHTRLDPSLLFVDVSHVETMQYLRTALVPLAARFDITDIDLSSLTSQQRRFTQGVARYIYDQLDDAGRPRFAGIRYMSRLNSQWECWAVFDNRIRHMPGWPNVPANVLADDPDLQDVARLFGLTIEMFPGQDHCIRPWRT